MTLREYFERIDFDTMDENIINRLANMKITEFIEPLTSLIQRAQLVETNDTLHYDISYFGPKEGWELDDPLYTVSYPYMEPVVPEWCKLTKEQVRDLPDSLLSDWIERVNSRVHPYIESASPYSAFTEYANDDRCGIILHAYTGDWIRFNYEELSCFDTILMPEGLITVMQSFVSGYKEPIWSSRPFLHKFIQTAFQEDRYQLLYQLGYLFEDGKTDSDYTIVNPVPLPNEALFPWVEYIVKMVEHRAKVIYLP